MLIRAVEEEEAVDDQYMSSSASVELDVKHLSAEQQLQRSAGGSRGATQTAKCRSPKGKPAGEPPGPAAASMPAIQHGPKGPKIRDTPPNADAPRARGPAPAGSHRE
ncbi:hypothetical protein CRENBAI_013801 [Crenichthys baileyi]|uniref:Uncharacterized protein n=1 Tax=Crenichthys baileyi TaxID=28760 RepID=A0AAV9SIE9_9TELE